MSVSSTRSSGGNFWEKTTRKLLTVSKVGWGLAFTGLMGGLFENLNRPVDVLGVTHVVNRPGVEKAIRQTGVTVYEG